MVGASNASLREIAGESDLEFDAAARGDRCA
jgi:hypothetical protein